MKKYITMEDILGKDSNELLVEKQGEFKTERVGVIAYACPENDELAKMRKDCRVYDKHGDWEVDSEKLMVRLIVTAVDKDKRSTFTFANKELLTKLGVVTADAAVQKLLLPGEINEMAAQIQTDMGFGKKAEDERAETVKNS